MCVVRCEGGDVCGEVCEGEMVMCEGKVCKGGEVGA